MTAHRPRRRRGRSFRRGSGSALFCGALALATGAAFFAGSRLRAQLPPARSLTPTAMLAQADSGESGSPSLLSPINRARVAQKGSVAAPAAANGAEVVVVEDERSVQGARSTFELIYNLVQENYVDSLPSDSEMSRGAVRAMLAALNDPDAHYVSPEQRTVYEAETRGDYAGIGAALSFQPTRRDGYTYHALTVVSPLPGSPAKSAGLKSGDVITRIDGRYVMGGGSEKAGQNRVAPGVNEENGDANEDDAAKKSEGEKDISKKAVSLLNAYMMLRSGSGEKRVLTVRRSGVSAPLTIEVTSAVTRIAPLETKAVADGAAYIRIPVFTEDTEAALKKALTDMGSAASDTGLVLDLRGNPGRDLESARRVASLLGGKGTFLNEAGPGGKKITLSLTGGGKSPVTGKPIVILVDRGTASAAEALAVTLADQGIATLVGGRTFGDAVAQGLYPLPDGAAFTLPMGKWTGPKGTEWNGAGISPKVTVADDANDDTLIARAVIELKSRHPHVAVLGASSGKGATP